MPTAVLVHGGFHGGWCWARVAAPLRARGWDVFTPTLTGLADRAHLLTPEVDLETHVADVTGLIEAEELEDVVLVGHSAGGTVITVVADRIPERLSAAAYLDAALPADGQSMLDVAGEVAGDFFRRIVAERGDGWRIPAGAPFTAEAIGVDDPRDRAWVDRRVTDHPFAAFAQPARLTGAGAAVPRRLLVRCTRFRTAYGDPQAERCDADPAWEVQRWDCGHHVAITDPGRVVAAIDALR